MRGPNGEPTFKCGYCLDTGYAFVWRRHALRVYQDWLADPNNEGKIFHACDHSLRFAIPCCCERGQAITPDQIHYQPSRHPRVYADYADTEDPEIATLASLAKWLPENRPAPVAEEFDVRNYQFQD